MPEIIPQGYFRHEDVVGIARDLIGKILVTNVENTITSAIIVETEAYKGPEDKACHAYNNRLTPRTEVMFKEGGIAYVYICYGIHRLFNVVTGPEGVGSAVLIRGVEPLQGLETMFIRRNNNQKMHNLTQGPGLVSQALGITTDHNGVPLILTNEIWLENAENVPDDQVIASPRVGVEPSGPIWSKMPWRFRLKGNKWVSPAK